MRNRIILYIIFTACTLMLLLQSCKDMDSVYEQYVVPGGKTYPGKANDLIAYSGHNRVKLMWMKGSDPSITQAKVFWNYYADSLVFDVDADADSISCVIDSLEENNYSFMVRHYNKNGDVSITSEVLGTAYGANYSSGLRNRAVSSLALNQQGGKVIKWGEADITNGIVGMELQYTDSLNNDRCDFFNWDEASSIISAASNFQYRTLYLPDSLCIDTFYTDFEENLVKAEILKENWIVSEFSNQHNSSASNRVTNIIDGNLATRWHTHLTESSYPHYVTIDMGRVWNLSAVTVARANNNENGCETFQIMVSTDNESWADAGTFEFDRFKNGVVSYELEGEPAARYFKFIGLSGPFNYMVMGELGAYGN